MERANIVGFPEAYELPFIIDFVVPANSESSFFITLPSNDFLYGELMMHIRDPEGPINYRRLSFHILFTRNFTDGISQSAKIVPYNVYGYLIDVWMPSGYRYDDDGKLSEAHLSNVQGTGMSYIKYVQITTDGNGDPAIEIRFRNIDPTTQSKIDLEGRARVWRI